MQGRRVAAPVVLDVIVRPSREALGDLAPLVAQFPASMTYHPPRASVRPRMIPQVVEWASLLYPTPPGPTTTYLCASAMIRSSSSVQASLLMVGSVTRTPT
jgi:hypothetical protein